MGIWKPKGSSLVISGGVVDPPQTNLIGWYTADQGITKSGDDISQWDDRTTNGNDLTQTGATTLKPQLLNDERGNPYVAFLKSRAGHLVIPSGVDVDARDASIFVVAHRCVDTTGGGYDDQSYLIGLGSQGGKLGIQSGQGPGDWIQGFGTGELATTIQNQNMFCLYGIVSGASATTIYQNGQNQVTVPQATAGASITGGLVGNHGSVTTLEWDGAYYAILIYDAALGASEIADVYAWAAANYSVGQTNTVQLAFTGDSITSGTGANTGMDYPIQVGRLRDWDFDGINIGHPGQGLPALNTNDTAQLDTGYDATEYSTAQIVIVTIGTNNLAQGDSAASILTNLQTYVTDRHTAGWDVLVGTITPQAGITGAEETARISLNTSIRDNTGSWHEGVVDFDGDSRLQDETDTTYFDADQIHPNATGYGVMAGIASAAITAALP
jgi:lysophospholipase L1-like esterase